MPRRSFCIYKLDIQCILIFVGIYILFVYFYIVNYIWICLLRFLVFEHNSDPRPAREVSQCLCHSSAFIAFTCWFLHLILVLCIFYVGMDEYFFVYVYVCGLFVALSITVNNCLCLSNSGCVRRVPKGMLHTCATVILHSSYLWGLFWFIFPGLIILGYFRDVCYVTRYAAMHAFILICFPVGFWFCVWLTGGDFYAFSICMFVSWYKFIWVFPVFLSLCIFISF